MKRLNPPRELNNYERELLIHLLSKKIPGGEELKQQLITVRVIGEYPGNDPTIVLDVDKEVSNPGEVNKRIPVEAIATDADGVGIHFLVHVVDGYLDELEIFREDSKVIDTLPPISEIEIT